MRVRKRIKQSSWWMLPMGLQSDSGIDRLESREKARCVNAWEGVCDLRPYPTKHSPATAIGPELAMWPKPVIQESFIRSHRGGPCPLGYKEATKIHLFHVLGKAHLQPKRMGPGRESWMQSPMKPDLPNHGRHGGVSLRTPFREGFPFLLCSCVRSAAASSYQLH